MEIRDIIQEAVIKIIQLKRKRENGCEVALQIAEKRREAKVKGEKERYTYLNAVITKYDSFSK